MPSDLDVLRHVNNGKYLSLLDLGRLDLLLRSGLARRLGRAGWYPVVAAEAIQFKASLRLFQAFQVETRVLGWDEKAFLLQQQFVRDGVIVARASIWARLLKRGGGSVSTREVLTAAGYDGPERPMPDWAKNWNNGETAFA
jgi:acyl-CoA thioesterase FadM